MEETEARAFDGEQTRVTGWITECGYYGVLVFQWRRWHDGHHIPIS